MTQKTIDQALAKAFQTLRVLEARLDRLAALVSPRGRTPRGRHAGSGRFIPVAEAKAKKETAIVERRR